MSSGWDVDLDMYPEDCGVRLALEDMYGAMEDLTTGAIGFWMDMEGRKVAWLRHIGTNRRIQVRTDVDGVHGLQWYEHVFKGDRLPARRY